jgi:hypothetical protein
MCKCIRQRFSRPPHLFSHIAMSCKSRGNHKNRQQKKLQSWFFLGFLRRLPRQFFSKGSLIGAFERAVSLKYEGTEHKNQASLIDCPSTAPYGIRARPSGL